MTNNRDFPKFRNYLVKTFNVHVKRASSKARKENKSKFATIVESALIDKNDTAQLILLKHCFFWINLNFLSSKLEAIASLPERFDAKPLAGIPELIIIYRRVEKSRSGNYQITIPHYDGTRSPKAPKYKKGNRVGMLTLKDGSKLLVIASNDTEAEKVINQLKKYINTKFLTDNFVILDRKGRKLKEAEYKPFRADYYPYGHENNVPEWRHYY